MQDGDADNVPFHPISLLKLFLGLNASKRISSVSTQAWEYLTLQELLSLRLLSKQLWEDLKYVEYTSCRDGHDYSVPFPGFPGLFATSDDRRVYAGLFQHQLASLHSMHQAETRNRDFGALRGGILGDAPGLGKTVTLLALITSTAGTRPVNPPEFWNEDGIGEGWKLLRTNVVGKESILGTMRPISKWIHKLRRFRTSIEFETFRKVALAVEPPYDDDRFPTLMDFQRFVIRELKDVVPSYLLEQFRMNSVRLKASLDKRDRKLLANRNFQRLSWERALVPAAATLIVVPDALYEHWFQQIQRHVKLDFFVDRSTVIDYNGIESCRRGVVYMDGIGDVVDILEGRKTIRSISLDTRTAPPWELSQYLVVLTTFSRCQAEFETEVEFGRLEGLDLGGKNNSGQTRRGGRKRRYRDAVDSEKHMRSSLLQMRWLRLVVDEGHELGTHPAGNAVTRFINEIAAERRWVLSGTPTTGDEDGPDFCASALDQIQRLLFFLRHPKYGHIPKTQDTEDEDVFRRRPKGRRKKTMGSESSRVEKARDEWLVNVKLPFLARKEEGRRELVSVLKETLVIHRKEDIRLPSPIFRQIENDVVIPSSVETDLRAQAVSSLDLVTKFDDYLHSSDFQTLVDLSQADYIVKAVRQAREDLLKRGGNLQSESGLQPISEMTYMNEGKDLRPIKAVVYSSESNNLLSVTDHIIRLLGFNYENVSEMYASADIGDSSSELTRFRHGIRERRVCPICGHENDVKANRCNKILVEVAGETGRFLIEPERILRTFNVSVERLQGEALSNYNKLSKFWRVGDQLLIDIRNDHPVLKQREKEATWNEYGADKCREQADLHQYQSRDWYFGPFPPEVSSSSESVPTAEFQLVKWSRCGYFHNPVRWYKGPLLSDQPVEQIQEDVFLLSLDAGLAHGLDLSFVTHIFLLEPIDDAALLEQVTSRAHRLGATGPVSVETVNTFYKVSKEMEAALKVLGKDDTISDGKEGPLSLIKQEKKKVLQKVVCSHCYRPFDCMASAEYHERTNCPRNPDNISAVDPFHLSSVYREIKPPPPLKSGA